MMSVQTVPLTAGTASLTRELPPNSVALLLRCPSANTDNVYVSVGGNFAGTMDLIIRPGESISLSQELWLIFKATLNASINANDYLRGISYYSATAAQTLYLDAVTWAGV